MRPCLSPRAQHETIRGATAVEYGLMVAAIAITIIVGVTAFGIAVTDLFRIPAECSGTLD